MSNYKIPDEFIEWIAEVMAFGATKHGDENWMQPDGKKSSHDEMHGSMHNHFMASYHNERKDPETGLDPLQHLATRALMTLWRKKRNLP